MSETLAHALTPGFSRPQVRGEKVRTATLGHVWPKWCESADLPGVVFHNIRRGKSNEVGECTHAGWLISKDPRMCLSGIVGVVFLYRFLFMGEPFPKWSDKLAEDDHDDDGDKVSESIGFKYRWLPLFRTQEEKAIDSTNKLVAVRPLDDDSQRRFIKTLTNAAGVDQVFSPHNHRPTQPTNQPPTHPRR